VPDDFPEIATLVEKLEWLDEEIPEVEHWLITAEQSRAKTAVLARETALELSDDLGGDFTPELERDVNALLDTRQDLLDELIERGGRYSNELSEYRSMAAGFLSKLEQAERFLFSQVLWSRSVPRPVIPRPADIGAAVNWYLSPDRLGELELGVESWRGLAPAVLVLALLVVFRSRLRARLAVLGDRALDPATDGHGLSLRAMFVTILLAAPVPLALTIVGIVIERSGDSPYWQASSRALFHVAAVAAIFELARHVFSPRGLAEAHFGWPVTATEPLSRGLVLTELIGLPPLFAALHIAFTGMGFYNPDELQLHNNTLGRVLFIVSMLVIGSALLGLLRPERKEQPEAHDIRVPWPRQFSDYAFPTAFLGAYPVVLLATIVPALLAVFGFYVTAILLAYQMLRTLVFGIAVLLVAGLVHRWRSTERRRLAADRASDGDDPARLADLEVAADQTRHLFRFTVVSVLLVGLFVIWSDAMPMLQQLKRVQLFPRVEVLEPIDTTPETLLATARPPVETAQPRSSDPVEPPADPAAGAATGEEGRGTGPAGGSAPLTLWSLMEAILAAVVTYVLVRNLPGVIEILLQRRTGLDSGARVAFATLVRYSTTIIGTIAVFGLLGIGWSKVQWLAAALTFGLGFGLQEIVANFVSGIILLVERPVRVGDVVTIGTLMGRVSRIQIRATTITLWDRSEMIVPNKEFITTKLVNWTLSDSKRRIEIPLRVAYGADLDHVKQLLVDEAKAHPLVLEDPEPHALLIAFGDDAINFELRFVVDFGNGIQAKDDVQMAIDRSFKEHGIDFALPQLRLQLSEGSSPIGSESR
jgi:potassium efflux system protein